MLPDESKNALSRRRLEAWKDIAKYLGKDQRTAQRYKKHDRLPVYREGGKVFAWTDEIDRWRLGRTAGPSAEAPVQLPREWWRLIVALLIVVVITAATWWDVLHSGDIPVPTPPLWGRLLVKSTSEGKSPKRVALGQSADLLTVAPDGSKVYAASYSSRILSILQTKDSVVTTLTLPSDPFTLAMSPDGHRLYVGSRVSGIAVIDTIKEQVLPEVIDTGGAVFDLAITPDGKKLFMAMSMKGVKRLLIGKKRIKQITDQICPEHLKLDPQGRSLYVSYQCGGPKGHGGHDSLEVFNVETEKSVGFLSGPPMVGTDPAVSPDGRLVVLDGRDACASPQYDHEGCLPGFNYVLHFMWTDSRQVFQTLGHNADTAAARFLDPRHFLFLGDSISVMDTTTYAVLEKWEHTPDQYYLGFAVGSQSRRVYVGSGKAKELLVMEAESPSCSPPTDGLYSFYPGDGVAEDIVSRATLTMQGNVRFGPGRVGQAFLLDGRTGYLIEPSTRHYWFGKRDSSVALYVKFENLEGERTILDRSSIDTPAHIRLVKTKDDHFAFEFAPIRDAAIRLESAMPAVANRWFHLAVTKSDEAVSLYVNGELQDRTPHRAGSAVGDLMPAHLGARSDLKEFIQGKLDEILFYNRALSADEVRLLYRMRESGGCQI